MNPPTPCQLFTRYHSVGFADRSIYFRSTNSPLLGSFASYSTGFLVELFVQGHLLPKPATIIP